VNAPLPLSVQPASSSTGAAPTARKPLVLVPSCNRQVGDHPFHIAGKKYIDAVRLSGCQPLVVPGAVDEQEMQALLDLADGVFLTGSPSNVHPSHFDEAVHDPSLPLDPARDAWTLPFIRAVLERGIPLFAICRGFQEANVALGGSLYQAVQEVAGKHDHRGAPEDPKAPPEVVYALAHPVQVASGGRLAEIVKQAEFQVNSVHGQGVNRLAPGLRVEARAPDGLVEAFSAESIAGRPASGFNLCVQWHPEWQAADNPISQKLFRAFGDACVLYRDRHRAPQPAAL
jgi:putative glutamine amidotransferase